MREGWRTGNLHRAHDPACVCTWMVRIHPLALPMPIDTHRCDECGHKRDVCPECGDHKVTPMEPVRPSNDDLTNTTSVKRWVSELATDGDEATFENLCWNCGWKERRTIRVSVETET
jgi:hypothetical protein